MSGQNTLYFEPMTTIEQLNARGQGYLPGLIGIEFISIEPGRLRSRLALRPELLAPTVTCMLPRSLPLPIRLADTGRLLISPAGGKTSPP